MFPKSTRTLFKFCNKANNANANKLQNHTWQTTKNISINNKTRKKKQSMKSIS